MTAHSSSTMKPPSDVTLIVGAASQEQVHLSGKNAVDEYQSLSLLLVFIVRPIASIEANQ